MKLAITKAKEGIAKGNTPFGACLVRDGKVLCTDHNRVWERNDISAHAEIVAIRTACDKLGTIDLNGCTLFTTCEPCPMCFSAAHWAKISKIIYGARIEDAKNLGFHELTISNQRMKDMGGSEIKIEGPFLLKDSLDLFQYWNAMSDKKTY